MRRRTGKSVLDTTSKETEHLTTNQEVPFKVDLGEQVRWKDLGMTQQSEEQIAAKHVARPRGEVRYEPRCSARYVPMASGPHPVGADKIKGLVWSPWEMTSTKTNGARGMNFVAD